jgi:hypothetical protein
MVTRWVDEYFPGWVEVRFTAADGTEVAVTDKLPVFGIDMTVDTPLPVPSGLACDVLRRERDQDGGELAIVLLSYRVEDEDGRREFRVSAGQVT